MASNKYDLPPEKLLTLISVMGMTETEADENWDSSSEEDIEILANKGFIRAEVVKISSRTHLWKLHLTPVGIELLSQWTAEELLRIFRWDGIWDFIEQQQLAYIVRRLPLELLPEFLVHGLDRIRKAAESRLKELQSGN